MELFTKGNSFKTLIMHVIAASAAFIAIIILAACPIEYENYYYGTYTCTLLEESVVSSVIIVVLIQVIIFGVLCLLPFMKKSARAYKTIGGLGYTICGGLGFFLWIGALVELSEYSYSGYGGAFFFLFLSIVSTLVFGIILLASKINSLTNRTINYSASAQRQNYQYQQVNGETNNYQAPTEQVDLEEGVLYKLKGAQKILRVYEDRVTLEVVKNARALLTNNWFGGTKEIYYSDMLSIQFKASGNLVLGYIQFETASTHSKDNFNSENSWTFDYHTVSNEKAKEVENFVRNKMRATKTQHTQVQAAPQESAADQLLKWKNLLDSGVITQEEFDAKKKELLGL